ncbi:hypothetical protein [Bacteroides sp. 519]|uniref:hypothetical protein n=1 Tax=Bacteroides sp. 519 TaxID=2302937 RepID=UPI0013D6D0F3|nr:hypothetical protein [Bacteroides sp. 519]NDV56851.1 hypothetical protein [Bacteroides sp. 519]
MKIENLSSLVEKGYKVAFVKGNRAINSKNVSSKKESLKKYSGNLVPLMYVSGSEAVADGCELVDTQGNDIDAGNAEKYIVILDGQHRYIAAIEAKLDTSNIYLFENYVGAPVKELLAEANREAESWKGADFINGASLLNPKNELAKSAKEMADKGWPNSVIGQILCFASGKLGKADYCAIMAGKEPKAAYNLERAQYFIKSAEAKFSADFVGKRYLISVVSELATNLGYIAVCDAISKLSDATVKRIIESKSDEKVGIIRAALQQVLN